MIKCYRCSALATQGADGIINMRCDCFPPRLVRYDVVKHNKGTFSSSITYQSETPTACPFCYESIPQPERHECKKADPQLEPAILSAENSHDSARAENLENMSKQMEEHERTCRDCSYLKQCGFKTRCAEYKNLQDIQTYWEKRIKAQK